MGSVNPLTFNTLTVCDAACEVDHALRGPAGRSSFVKKYLNLDGPDIHLYDEMFNTERGDSFVAEMLAQCIQEVPSLRWSGGSLTCCGMTANDHSRKEDFVSSALRMKNRGNA